MLAVCVPLSLPLSAGVPANGEELKYSINWPSGLSLGEGQIRSSKTQGNWQFDLNFEAAVPGFAVIDKFTSIVTGNNCSVSFDKELNHGKRRTQERITFDSENQSATRETIGGGKSKITVPACARDALAFVFHLRSELAAGRLPKGQEVFYGTAYKVKVDYGGSQRVKVGDGMEDADRIFALVQGPVSQIKMEVFVGKDANRTPLVVRIPLSLGTFSLELVRQ